MRLKNSAIPRVVLILAGVLGALGFADLRTIGLALPRSVFGSATTAASDPPDLTPRVFLPAVTRTEPPPTIYDLDGTERDWDWLIATFGAVTLERGVGTAGVTVLRAVEGPATLVVHVENSDGDPLESVPVVFHWPDAPELLPEQQACGLDRGLVGYTDSRGDVGFGLGKGAYYFPPDGGPHVVWVATEGTDCLGGLGMLGGTNHIHLDSVWRMP